MKRKSGSVQARPTAKSIAAQKMAAALNAQPAVSEATRRFAASKAATREELLAQKENQPENVSAVQGATAEVAEEDNSATVAPAAVPTSMIGQPERMLDPDDVGHTPVDSQLIRPFCNEKDFFAQNMKSLLGSTNKYYPYIGGRCLCGTCICGNCRCVHFRAPRPTTFPLPTYAADYVAHRPQRTAQRVPQQENVPCPFPFSETSTYHNDYVPHSLDLQGPTLLNRAKLDSLGPTALRLRAPPSNATTYQLQFPDWGNCAATSLAPWPQRPSASQLPLIGRPESKLYGKFFADGQCPQPVRPQKPPQRSTLDALGSKFPRDFATTHRREFNPANASLRQPAERSVPLDNLQLHQGTFDGQYVPVSADFCAPARRLECPLRAEILRLRRALLEYARTQHIPF